MPARIVYPSVRLDRAEAAIPAAQVGNAQPLIRKTWAYRIGVSVINTKTIIVSPAFQGPAVITEWSPTISQAATVNATLGLYWSDDNSQQGTNQAPTVRVSGTPILENITYLTPQKIFTVEDLGVLDMTDLGGNVAQNPQMRINYYVPRVGQFFLKLALRNGAAGTHDSKGSIVIAENVSPEQVANFS
jgi:hypothetical protein